MAVGCVLLAACGAGESEGSPTTTTSTSTSSSTSTTEPPQPEEGTLDGLEISSGYSSFFARHHDTTYVVDAGRMPSTFEPTLRAFADDGTVRTYAVPTKVPLVYVVPFWADGGVSILGVECPRWVEGDPPTLDLNDRTGSLRAECGSADLVLMRWTPAGWTGPRTVMEAPSGFGFRAALGAQAVIGLLPGNDDHIVDLLTGEVDALPATPDGMQEICLQADGPVVVVDPESSADGGGSGGQRPRWTARRLEGGSWGAPVELPDGYVAGCLDIGGFLMDSRRAAVRVQVGKDGSLRTDSYGKPAPPNPQYQTILGILAQGNGRLYVHTGGEWVDAGKEPDGFSFPVGEQVLVEPVPDTGDEDGTTVRLAPLTLRLQG